MCCMVTLFICLIVLLIVVGFGIVLKHVSLISLIVLNVFLLSEKIHCGDELNILEIDRFDCVVN